MLDALFLEKLVPVLDKVFVEVISFVYAQDEFFIFINFFNIFFQIGRVVEKWVPGIYDLQQNI